MQYNKLSGSIPSSLGNLSSLIDIEISSNQLTGNLSALSTLKAVKTINLSFNHFSGEITFLGALSNLNYVDLTYNKCTGRIPFFRKSDQLTYLSLGYNLLSGDINHQFDSLTNSQLKIFLYNNQISGSIPSFKKLIHLNMLDLSNNGFSGTLPDLDSLKNLDYLNISNNQLTFAGMEKVVYEFSTTTYAPQATIHLNKTGNKFSVSAGGTLSNNTYNWYRYGKLFKTTIADSIIYVVSNGNYSVKVTNSVATALTLQSDTINYTIGTNMIAATQQNFQKNSSILIYPNPTKTTATILFKANGNYTINVSDITGKNLQTKSDVLIKGSGSIQINLSTYTSGVYFITVTSDHYINQTFKLYKQ